jgi:hypothetical protein
MGKTRTSLHLDLIPCDDQSDEGNTSCQSLDEYEKSRERSSK